MDKFELLAQLTTLLRALEQDLGIDDLSSAERDLYLAAKSLSSSPQDVITSTDMRKHALARSLAPATYHRALRGLITRGYLEKASGSRAKSYVLTDVSSD